MTGRPRFEDVSERWLRDHGTPDRTDAIWDAVRPDLADRRRREPSIGWWAPATAAAVFALGVFVGAKWFAEEAPPAALLMAEPRVAAEPAAAPRPADPVVVRPKHGDTPAFRRAQKRVVPRRSAPVPETPAEVADEASLLAPAGPPAWQLLADDGRYPEALAQVEEGGGFDSLLSSATAEQIMLLVDVARATGQRNRAVVALRRIVSQHGSDPNAPVAAWMLGNELVKMGDGDGAAQAFAMYRALSPKGDFAEDALARQFEVSVEQGDLDHAQKLADQYATDFPDGPRREEISTQLAALVQRVEQEQAEAESAAEPFDDNGEVPREGEAPEEPADHPDDPVDELPSADEPAP